MTSQSLSAASLFGVAWAGFLWSTPVFAERSLAPEVKTESCQRFSADQVRELVELELQMDAEGLSAASRYLLTVSCDEKQIHLELLDGHHELQMKRTIPQPPPQAKEPERTVALAAAELVFALGWRPGPEERAPVPVSHPGAEHGAEREQSLAHQKAASSDSHRATLRASYLVSLRSLNTVPYLASSALLAAQLQFKVPVRVGLGVGYEAGNSTSQDVVSQTVSTAFQFGYAWALSEHVDLAFEAQIRALYVRVERKPVGGLTELKASAWRPDFMLRVGPEWVPGTWGLGMSLAGGITTSHLELTDAEPEPYDFCGPWVGITMDLLLNSYFGGR